MIKREVVEGRPATVAYMNDHLEPVSEAEATVVKVVFDGGPVRVMFGRKQGSNAG